MTNKKKKKGAKPPKTAKPNFGETSKDEEKVTKHEIFQDDSEENEHGELFKEGELFENIDDTDGISGTTINQDDGVDEIIFKNNEPENIPDEEFKDDDPFKQGGFGVDDDMPPPVTEKDFDLEYDEDTSYLFIFGPSSTGKTVLISSILYYIESVRSIEFGDTLINNNDVKKLHEREGNKLWKELSSTLFENKFPKGTARITEHPLPRHINANFIPSNTKLSDFKFCLMDMSGEDLHQIDYDKGNRLPSGINVYVEKMPQDNMCFTYILDPISPKHSKTTQLNVFKAFIDLLDKYKHSNSPILFLISKWDVIAEEYESAEEYLKSQYQPIWGILNQKGRNISFAEFSIGKVDSTKNPKESGSIERIDPHYVSKVFNWFYQEQTGHNILSDISTRDNSKWKNLFNR